MCAWDTKRTTRQREIVPLINETASKWDLISSSEVFFSDNFDVHEKKYVEGKVTTRFEFGNCWTCYNSSSPTAYVSESIGTVTRMESKSFSEMKKVCNFRSLESQINTKNVSRINIEC